MVRRWLFTLRPQFTPSAISGAVNYLDAGYQQYQPIKPKTSDVLPGFTFGGPILKDRIFFYLGFNPEWNDQERTVNYGPTNGGEQAFSRNTQTYFSTARIDATVSQKVRVSVPGSISTSARTAKISRRTIRQRVC